MKVHSWLFVPADSEKKLGKLNTISADAFILDLEDSVATDNKPLARKLASGFIRNSEIEPEKLWVRINPLTSRHFENDLEAVMPAGPGGIVLPKSRSPEDVLALVSRLEAFEAGHGLVAGSTRILALVTETPQALFTLGGYSDCGPRLAGLTWGAEDLGSAIGSSMWRDGNGEWTPPFQLVRNLCLFAAHAAGVAAVDTIQADFGDVAGLTEECEEARRDGFNGKLAIHPAQVRVINKAFQPSEAEIEQARKVVALFEANPGAGVLELDGVMLDKPHLKAARRILGL